MPGLATTFELLGNSANEAASAVLLEALDASQRDIRDLALPALLTRHSASAELNVLRRWPDLSSRWKDQIAQRVGWLSGAIRTVILSRDAHHFESACSAAAFTRDYDLIPLLAAAATDRTNVQALAAATATLELAELLAEEVHSPRDYRIRRDPQLQRSHVVASLETWIGKFTDHGRRELLEAFLLLADRENALLKRVLQAPSDPVFPPLVEALTTSSRPAIERLLLSYLDDPHAPFAAIGAIAKRSDVSFLRHLTRKIGGDPSPTVRANLRRIDAAPWIHSNLSLLDALRETEQAGALHLVVDSAIGRDDALNVVAYILRHGLVGARRVAAELLAGFVGDEANRITLSLLDDDDVEVRAAAAKQLRGRGIPGAIQKLLDLLDSPHPAEREAAQAGLVEFTYERFAARFDELTPEARKSSGPLVRRVDTLAVRRVSDELESPNRGRKKRALEMAIALDAVPQLQESIAALLSDEDQYLRIDAVRALATVDGEFTRRILRDALLDSQPLVQQAAEAALAGLTGRDTVSAEAAARDTVRLSSVGLPKPPAIPNVVPTTIPATAEVAG
jgi:hypothetical protein